jgi:hypothetical protein
VFGLSLCCPGAGRDTVLGISCPRRDRDAWRMTRGRWHWSLGRPRYRGVFCQLAYYTSLKYARSGTWKTPVIGISLHVYGSPTTICTETRSIYSVQITPACSRLLDSIWTGGPGSRILATLLRGYREHRQSGSLNLAHFVARQIDWRGGVYPLRYRADRPQRRAPLRCLLIPIDTTFDLLQTAIN